MADVSSRSFNAASGYVLSDDELLSHFNENFPLPQNRSWKLVTLPPEDTSKVLSTLRGERLTMAQWMKGAASNTGETGAPSQAQNGGSLPTSRAVAHSNKPQSSHPLLTGSGKASLDAATELLRNQLIEQSEPLGRPSNWLDGATQPRRMEDVSASFNSGGYSKPTEEATRHPSHN